MAVIAGHAMAYKPAKSRRWEQDARLVARQVMGTRKPLTGCLYVRVDVFLTPPASWPAWKRTAALLHHIRPSMKPDASNYLKAAEDALNGVVWIDDAQIIDANVSKAYCERPVVIVLVKEASAFPAQTAKKSDLESKGLRA